VGLYIGACVALLLHLVLRPGLSRRFLAVHGLFLAIVAPFGFHWLPQGPSLRIITGVLCGFGVATFLWVMPADHWIRRSGHPAARSTAWYSLSLAAVLVLLPLAASWDTPAARWVLDVLAAAGLLGLAALVLCNIGIASMLFAGK
jgi:hypothetical protein